MVQLLVQLFTHIIQRHIIQTLIMLMEFQSQYIMILSMEYQNLFIQLLDMGYLMHQFITQPLDMVCQTPILLLDMDTQSQFTILFQDMECQNPILRLDMEYQNQ